MLAFGLDSWRFPLNRDMSAEEACELGRRAIYHATFRDAVSGGTVSGAVARLPAVHHCHLINLLVDLHMRTQSACPLFARQHPNITIAS